MNLNPIAFFIMAALLFFGSSLIAFFVEGTAFAIGLMVVGIILMLNLLLWFVFVYFQIERSSRGYVSGSLSFVFFMKFVFFGIGLWVAMKLFSPMTVLIGNSIIVASLLIPSLFFVLMNRKQECCHG